MKTQGYRLFLSLCTGMLLMAVCPGTIWANTVTTPCGTNVGHSHITPDWTAAQKAAIQGALQTDFPQATVIGPATKNYNCHSYAWAGAAEWISDPGVYIDSYELDAAEGHKLTYMHCLTHSPTHSAIDTEPLEYKANSKWGNLCLMNHDWDYVLDGRPCSLGGNYANYGSVVAIYDSAECICGDHEDCDT
jgi:hypothetical protein